MDKLPTKDVAIYPVHVILIFGLIAASLLNLTMGWGNQNLWITVLTGSVGFIIPAPMLSIKREDIKDDKENDKLILRTKL